VWILPELLLPTFLSTFIPLIKEKEQSFLILKFWFSLVKGVNTSFLSYNLFILILCALFFLPANINFYRVCSAFWKVCDVVEIFFTKIKMLMNAETYVKFSD